MSTVPSQETLFAAGRKAYEIEQDAGACGIARTLWNMNMRAFAVAGVQTSLKERGFERDSALVEQALEHRARMIELLTSAAASLVNPIK